MVSSKRVIIVGIPGVGKTTVITTVFNKLTEQQVNTKHMVFGTAMFEEAQKIGVTERDDMRKLSTDKQKQLQISAATSISKHEDDIVLVDTHLFIKTPNGYLPGLPDYILKALSPTHVILIEGTSEEVIKRRQNDPTRARDAATAYSVELENSIARSMLSTCSILTGATINIIRNEQGQSDLAADQIVTSLTE
ncbi:MAG: adenylate kinase [Thermoproteota archaeon]|jgi:adenylate kinase